MKLDLETYTPNSKSEEKKNYDEIMYLHGVKTLFVQYLHEILSKLSTNSREAVFWQREKNNNLLDPD